MGRRARESFALGSQRCGSLAGCSLWDPGCPRATLVSNRLLPGSLALVLAHQPRLRRWRASVLAYNWLRSHGRRPGGALVPAANALRDGGFALGSLDRHLLGLVAKPPTYPARSSTSFAGPRSNRDEQLQLAFFDLAVTKRVASKNQNGRLVRSRVSLTRIYLHGIHCQSQRNECD